MKRIARATGLEPRGVMRRVIGPLDPSWAYCTGIGGGVAGAGGCAEGAYNGSMRYLAVDPGGKRVGLAFGDDATGVVTPLEIIAYAGLADCSRAIAAAAERHRADRVVIGLPTDADGNRTPACRRSEALARRLEERGLEVVFQPEFMTTTEARRRARETGVPRANPIDHLAAQVLLEEHLARI